MKKLTFVLQDHAHKPHEKQQNGLNIQYIHYTLAAKIPLQSS